MARPLRLRPLTPSERRLLAAKLRDLSLAARIHQRYRVIEEVRKGHGIREAADRVGCHFTVAYDWIRRFNASGFATFEQVPNPNGRPPILQAAQLREAHGEYGSTVLGFNPSAILQEYAALLRARNREAEAKEVEALADARERSQIGHFMRLQQTK